MIGGNFSMSTIGDNVGSTFNPSVGGSFLANGDFTFTGNELDDEVFLEDNFQVLGNLMVDMGDGKNRADFDDLGGTNSAVGGQTTILGGSGNDTVVSNDAQSSFGDDVIIDLGDGTNIAEFLGAFAGSNVMYTGGSGSDTVSFGLTGTPADVNVKLGTGDDTFTVEAGAAITPTTMRVDFGGGNDTFVNNFGAFNFNASLLNLQVFTRHYFLADDIWNMTQLVDTGDITLDNNGAGGAIRLETSALTEMSPAANVRINLLDGASSNVTVDFDSALAGDLVLQLRHGMRDVMFTGSSNTIGGDAIVLAGNGVQNFHLATNADLVVGGDFIVNGRDALDTVDDGANNLDIGGNFILRGINLFVNDNTMNVGGNFNMISVLESEDTLLDNDGLMNIAGGINYIGGSGVDNVLLNTGGVSVGETLYVDLADASDVLNKQNVSLAGSVFGRVAIVGGDSAGGNGFLTDAMTSVTGDVVVVFTGSTAANTAQFFGTYGGTYGTYRAVERREIAWTLVRSPMT